LEDEARHVAFVVFIRSVDVEKPQAEPNRRSVVLLDGPAVEGGFRFAVGIEGFEGVRALGVVEAFGAVAVNRAAARVYKILAVFRAPMPEASRVFEIV